MSKADKWLDLRAAALSLSDVLHAIEHAQLLEIPDPLDRAWLRLSQAIEATHPEVLSDD